ncbi:MAG: saccharopine dehydrogenase NADP-binding domain-containing protein [Actinomycetota bacterium]|nr:saccharopine dehydrogenase NADP-binding domain-containing protein [Actinomycetota bacterium]
MSRAGRQDRNYDVVLFGATGFTGSRTAEYLARHGPPGMRWAIAGRNVSRLETIAERLSPRTTYADAVRIIRADSTDSVSLRAMAESSRVLASTVGPFVRSGEPLVAACAESGTDYLDITGEPEFVDRMWLDHSATAQRTGSRLVHACGFESVPHDLGVWFTLRHLPPDVPLSIAGYVRVRAGFSAGTYHSAIRALGRARQSAVVARQRRARQGSTTSRRVGSLPARPHRVPGTPLPRPGTWLASPGRTHRWAVPLPTIDPIVVRRSARALDRYGPDFRYGHYADLGGLPVAAAAMVGAGGLLAAAKIPPLRAGLLRLRTSGEGPDERRRSRSWFRVRFASTVGGAAGTHVLTEVSGKDPGYDETAKMLAESALSLAFDDGLPDEVGQLTPVQAMGDHLLARLQRAGMTFRTVAAQH